MKNGIRFFVCIIFIFILLLSALPVGAALQDLRYDNGAPAQTIPADELFDRFFADETPLSEFERAYLRSKDSLAFSYSTAALPDSLVSWNYDGAEGSLTISASAFRYTARNGEEVVWIPQTVRFASGAEQSLSKTGNLYSYTRTGVWNSGAVEFTVDYAWTVAVSAETADAILTGAFPIAKEIRDRLDAYEIDHAEWESLTALYAAYRDDLDAYEKAYARWEQKKQSYENYLAAKAAYDASVEEYQALSAAWDAYKNYGRLLAEYKGALEQYSSYGQVMDRIDGCLAIMETMFTATTDGNGWCFYPSVMGETVDSVLDNSGALIDAGAPKASINLAKRATLLLRPILAKYAEARSAAYETEFERKRAMFTVYAENYKVLRVQMGNLYDSINAIYAYAPAQTAMKTKFPEQIPHFRQFLSQLYFLQALLDDFETVNLNLPLPGGDGNLIVGDLVEDALRPADNNAADPVGVTFPTEWIAAPVAPEVVEKPAKELPPDPSEYDAPTPVEAPGAEPVAPEEVAAPGAEPEFEPLTSAEEALLAQYDAGLLTNRTAKGAAQTLSFTKSISKTATYENKRTVVFHKTDGSELERRTVEYGQPVETPPTLSNYQTEQYSYTFLGWIVTGSGAAEPLALDSIQTDLLLSPLFAREKRSYSVTWALWNTSVTQSVAYGERPVPPEATPTRPDDATNFYRFAGWSPEILPVSGDVTYTALWQSFPLSCQITWDLGNGNTTTQTVVYGTTPQYSGTPTKAPDERYTYTFVGWSPEPIPATENTTYTARWSSASRLYSITWDVNGTKTSVSLPYGTLPQYNGTPTKPQDAQYTYTFIGWSPEVLPVKADAIYTAQFQPTRRFYTVTWDIGDGKPLSELLAYGDTPQYNGTPTKAPDERYTYSFAGWSPEITTVTENATYTARWSSAQRLYTIIWNVNGTTTTVSLPYGALPQYSGTPTKPQDERNVYTFAGWSPEVTTVTENATYTARWSSTQRLYTIVWNVNGTQTSVSLPYGALPQYSGTPTKPQDERYTYTFAGWSPEVATVTESTTYTARWSSTERLYTIVWDVNGTQTSVSLPYGALPQYSGTPTKPQDERYTYTFAGWSPEIATVTENTTYTARWSSAQRLYPVTWIVNGTSTTTSFPYGAIPTYDGTPTKPQDGQNIYTFAGWSPEIVPVTDNATYTAVWSSSARPYTVVWDLGDTRVTQTYAFGDTPRYSGTPTKAPDERYTYTFAGWSPEITSVTENATYTARWSSAQRLYTVTWSVNGTTTTVSLPYGALPQYSGTPTKPQDERYTYTFAGWSPEITSVTENATYTARWSSTERLYTVVWNVNGTKTSVSLPYGALPQYSGTPTKPQDERYTYTFAGWSPEVTTVTENTTYTARWSSAQRFYTIAWSVNGTTTTVSLPYGALPQYSGTPTKEQDERYTYSFAGWSPEITTVTGAATYTALWSSTPRLYTIVWNVNGTTTTESLPYGALPQYSGTPTKPQDERYTYTFAGWSPEVTTVTENTTYTARWSSAQRFYTIAWSVNGATTTVSLPYGALPQYNGTPIKPQDERNVYTFAGWSPEIAAVTESTTYTARWSSTERLYTIVWDVNGTQTSVSLPYGALPAYDGTPTKEQDGQNIYTFAGWSPEIAAVTENATYTAVWSSSARPYTVVWDLGTSRVTQTYAYGDTPLYPGTPTKAPDERNIYTFAGWDRELATVTENTTYTARWSSAQRLYTIVWDVNGTQTSVSLPYGALPQYSGTPTKEQDERSVYTFAGWDRELTAVTENTTYTALWSSTQRLYTIVWNVNGTQTSVSLPYGALPQYSGTPTKPQDERYTYSFAGWSPEITTVTENATYTALWSSAQRLYTIVWSVNGTTTTVSLPYGALPQYSGTPTKPQDERYTYTFAGWSPEITTVTGAATYTARWSSTQRLYTIVWNVNGTTTTVSLPYDALPQYSGTPTKPQDERNVYTFAGWSPEVTTVTENTTYTALWSSAPRAYTVVWDLGDTRVTQTYAFGDMPRYNGTPTKAPDERNLYTFAGWSPEVTTVTENTTYTALWSSAQRLYTIVWSVNGTTTTVSLPYGALPTYDGTPTKPQDGQNIYTFAGWSPEIAAVTENVTYTAVWSSSARPYTVIWDLGTGRITQTYAFGDTPRFEGTPTKPQDERNTYTFAGWSPEITAVTENATYTARWSSTPRLYTIVWDVNGTTTTESLPYGALPQYNGTPTKPQDERNVYTFAGWSPEITTVTGAVTYTALWSSSDRLYTVVWDVNGTQTSASLPYGALPQYSGTPTKPQDERNVYSFAGWSPEITTVTGAVTYTALWSSTPRLYTIVWDVNGTTTTESLPYGALPQYNGTPTKEQDERYVYTFAGWSPEINSVNENATYTAVWSSVDRLYTIVWNVNGTTTTESLPYGALPTYNGTPAKEQDAQYTYTFTGWSPEILPVKADAAYTAQFLPVRRFYTVVWDLGDGRTISELLAYGELPVYEGSPTKEQDGQNIYTFAGWSPEIATVTGDATYTAVWSSGARPYTVVWDLGTSRVTQTYAYGDTPQFEGTPTKEQDERNLYTFAGWSPEITTVTENATYTARWETAPRLYTVTWDLGGGVTSTATYVFGELPHYDGVPTKPQDGNNTYVFAGWSPEVAVVNGDVTYTAQWRSDARFYTVTWDLGDENRVTQTYAFGDMPAFDGTPTKADDALFTYTFAGWDRELAEVTENATYTAVWKSEARLYTVTWDLGDESRVTQTYPFGATPAFDGTPTKADDEQYFYTFTGWSPELRTVTEDSVYTARWKAVPRFYTTTWDLGNGEPMTVQTPNGELPVFEGTPTRENDELYCYTFAGWSPKLAPATANATYTALWQKSPLVKDADGNTHNTETTEESVIVDAEQEELDLKNALDFAAEDGKTLSLERENATVTLDAGALKEALPEMARVQWVEDPEAHSFKVNFANADGTPLQTDLSYLVSLSYAENQILTVYDADGETLQKLTPQSVDSTARLATYSIPAGKTVVCKLRYRLIYQSSAEHYSNLPDYAERGEIIALDVVCNYGYEFTGATLVSENGTETEVGSSFTMPAESLIVKLHISPIVYHVVFVCNGEILSERDYAFGETIEVPEDPALPDEGENRFVFRGWSPQVSETATGEAREQIYEASFSIISNRPPEKIDSGLWQFFVSPIFLGGMAILIVLVVGIVLLIRWRVKVRRRKKAAQAKAKQADTPEKEPEKGQEDPESSENAEPSSPSENSDPNT